MSIELKNMRQVEYKPFWLVESVTSTRAEVWIDGEKIQDYLCLGVLSEKQFLKQWQRENDESYQTQVLDDAFERSYA